MFFIKSLDKVAFTYKEEVVTFPQLLKKINFYSSLYEKSKTKKIAILSENRPEWIYAFYSGWKNNAIVVPIDHQSQPDEILYILNDCQPEVIFFSKDQEAKVLEIKNSLSFEINCINFDNILDESKNHSDENFEIEDINKTAVIIYTSGTTGSPKGVMLSFENLLTNILAVSEHIPIFAEERSVLLLLPLHHIFPLMGTLIAPFFVGATVAISPSMVSSDIIETIQKNKVSIIIGVPRLYEAIRNGIMDKINKNIIAKTLFKLARLINNRNFSKKIFGKVHNRFGGKIDYLVSGGAKLNEQVARDFKTLGFEMLEGYGMTEAAPMITFTRPNRWKIGSAGQAMPGIEVKSKDGEIVARGKNIMQGYYNKKDETDKVIKDGWLHTGDLGHFDSEGFIYLTGRSKDIIVLSNGKNIYPEEIEVKLKKYSKLIVEVAVFNSEDQLSAAIYPDFKKIQEQGILNIEEYFRNEIIDKYNQNSSASKRITKFYLFKEELPKTRLGKIQRFKLTELVENSKNKSKKNIVEPQFEEYLIIKNYLQEEKKSEIFPDDHLEIDLGLDSLDKVSLIVFLKSTFGVDLHETTLVQHSTVEKLSHYIKEKKNKLALEKVRWTEIFKEKIDIKLPKSLPTHNLVKFFSKIFLNLYFKVYGEGIQNIPKEPFIIAANHQSYLDALFVTIFLKNKVFRNTYFYAKEKHVRNWFLKFIAKRANVIVMDINNDLKLSLQKLAEVLKRKKNILIFPEGTRSFTGELKEFKKFFAILSRELNVPIVPVTIDGANKALPKGSIFPRPGKKIKVKFHKPIYPENFSYDDIVNIVQQNVAEALN